MTQGDIESRSGPQPVTGPGEHDHVPTGPTRAAGRSFPLACARLCDESRVAEDGDRHGAPPSGRETGFRQGIEPLLAEEPEAAIVGCDQLVSFEGRIYGKPGTAERAIAQLAAMSGKTHDLITAARRDPRRRYIPPYRYYADSGCVPLARDAIERYVVIGSADRLCRELQTGIARDRTLRPDRKRRPERHYRPPAHGARDHPSQVGLRHPIRAVDRLAYPSPFHTEAP